jgi:hypothetical protein
MALQAQWRRSCGAAKERGDGAMLEGKSREVIESRAAAAAAAATTSTSTAAAFCSLLEGFP